MEQEFHLLYYFEKAKMKSVFAFLFHSEITKDEESSVYKVAQKVNHHCTGNFFSQVLFMLYLSCQCHGVGKETKPSTRTNNPATG